MKLSFTWFFLEVHIYFGELKINYIYFFYTVFDAKMLNLLDFFLSFRN